MIKVKRFCEWMKSHMLPGRIYETIPYDYDGTDALILDKFNEWSKSNQCKIISITGPLHVRTPSSAASAGGMYAELTVIYEDGEA